MSSGQVIQQELKSATVMTIGGGAIPELFSYELNRVMANIDDRNTAPGQKRKLTIEVEFEPNDSREQIETTISVKSKLAGVKKSQSITYAVRDRSGKLVAYNHEYKQPSLFAEPQPASAQDAVAAATAAAAGGKKPDDDKLN